MQEKSKAIRHTHLSFRVLHIFNQWQNFPHWSTTATVHIFTLVPFTTHVAPSRKSHWKTTQAPTQFCHCQYTHACTIQVVLYIYICIVINTSGNTISHVFQPLMWYNTHVQLGCYKFSLACHAERTRQNNKHTYRNKTFFFSFFFGTHNLTYWFVMAVLHTYIYSVSCHTSCRRERRRRRKKEEKNALQYQFTSHPGYNTSFPQQNIMQKKEKHKQKTKQNKNKKNNKK